MERLERHGIYVNRVCIDGNKLSMITGRVVVSEALKAGCSWKNCSCYSCKECHGVEMVSMLAKHVDIEVNFGSSKKFIVNGSEMVERNVIRKWLNMLEQEGLREYVLELDMPTCSFELHYKE